MDVSLLKESHENMFLREGYLLALQFGMINRNTWVVLRILGREPSNIKPYSLGAVAAESNLASWNEILDAAGRRLLDPPERFFINHFFWGVNKPKARVFFQYPTRQDRWSLTSIERTTVGDIGFVDGDDSPYEGPFSLKTEVFTVEDLYPAFQIYNPLGDAMDNVMLHFDVMRYTYQIIKDRTLLAEILTGRRPAKLHTVAGIDPRPAPIPDWLRDIAGNDALVYASEVTRTETTHA